MLKHGVLLIWVFASAVPVCAQSIETVFAGQPSIRISELGVNRVSKALDTNEADGYECTISRIGEKFYWASRENREMLRHEYGSFVTYVALDGSGYVKHIVPKFKGAASLMSDAEATYDYVEHIPIGLASVTYYGVARD